MLLNVSSDEKVLSVTYGELKPPLGKHRLKVSYRAIVGCGIYHPTLHLSIPIKRRSSQSCVFLIEPRSLCIVTLLLGKLITATLQELKSFILLSGI